ncbi:hypothetical protein [Actinomadura formosensis]|uniref:hypothetical protein n=1 Tax=Actinomadura formosensis TaxID=60706 RepID=UPI00082FEEC3|nr:hypothetical protein [Actinomadura formosensis]
MSEDVRFKVAVRSLHREKNAAYGPAWKRRGELISVLANIARKVDRLEQAAAGAPATRDENLLDTVVDLLVYSLKYQTYLADQDEAVGRGLLGGRVQPPYSDGRGGFEGLLETLDLTVLDDPDVTPSLAEAAGHVITSFSEVEQCFMEALPPAPVPERLTRAINLTYATTEVVGVLRREAPALYVDFLATWEGE